VCSFHKVPLSNIMFFVLRCVDDISFFVGWAILPKSFVSFGI